MYDRQTETWWQQVTGEAIVGELTGTKLRFVAQTTLAWQSAREMHPRMQVLSRNTGPQWDYGRNPYVGYDDRAGSPIREFSAVIPIRDSPSWSGWWPWRWGRGGRCRSGLWRGSTSRTPPWRVLPLAVFWRPGAASALDRSNISESRDVGQTAVFERRLNGRTHTFRSAGAMFEDRENGSRWDLAGRAVSGPLRGQRLRAVPHGNHFWFAWVVFRPDTQLWTT